MKTDACWTIISLSLTIFIISIVIEFSYPTLLYAANTSRIRAKIGVQISSQDRIIRAKSKEILKPGDAVRLYVHSETSCYVYIIHTDGKNVSLLNITEQKIQSSTLIMPSAQAFYEIDGQSSMEKFTIICSPEKIQELSGMEKKNITNSEWTALETSFQKKSAILNADDEDEPFAINGNVASIAGNVRGITNSIKNSSGANDDPFLKELQIFSGNGLVIKTYQFQIKK
ncbi:MAG: hypothetical protein HQK73_10570 [Desulfamplus sp.]|nr:hypothetical protein [Desulfamplus sp.]